MPTVKRAHDIQIKSEGSLCEINIRQTILRDKRGTKEKADRVWEAFRSWPREIQMISTRKPARSHLTSLNRYTIRATSGFVGCSSKQPKEYFEFFRTAPMGRESGRWLIWRGLTFVYSCREKHGDSKCAGNAIREICADEKIPGHCNNALD